MEAPEKLYILFNHPYTVDYTKLNKRRDEEEIEYTRTDAFIEKAAEWLKEQDEMVGISFTEDFIVRFRNYMKEE